MSTNYFWLNQKETGSGYKDETGEVYHYRGTTPGSKQLSEGDRFIYYRPGEFVIFGTGKIGKIETQNEGVSGFKTEYFAHIDEYTQIEPPIQVRDIKEKIPFLRDRNGLSGVPQSGIYQIDKEVFDMILNESQVTIDI